MLNLDKLFLAPTSELPNLRDRIDAELKRRENGEIPDPLKCAVCGKEIVGDSYEIYENARACDICVKLNEQLQQDVNDGSPDYSKYKVHLDMIEMTEGTQHVISVLKETLGEDKWTLGAAADLLTDGDSVELKSILDDLQIVAYYNTNKVFDCIKRGEIINPYELTFTLDRVI